MSWVALPVEPAYMGRRSGKTRRSPCSLAWLSNKIGIVDITKPPMFVTMPTIRQQKCIADLGKQRRSQGRCFSLICWKRRY